MKNYKIILLPLVAFTFTFCSKNADIDPNAGTNTNPTTEIGKGQAGINGITSIDAWDKLATTEKNRIKEWNTIFMHQSVGGDLEDGANNNGFKFEYFDLNQKPKGLSGNVFSASNGNPIGKIAEFKTHALTHKSILKIAIFKSKDDGNAAKMKMAQWMKDTFKDKDNIFDLQEIESDNGSCNLNGVWTICNKYRSTTSCPSKGQGIDAPEGQGHLCENAATRISKAFLYSIYQSGK